MGEIQNGPIKVIPMGNGNWQIQIESTELTTPPSVSIYCGADFRENVSLLRVGNFFVSGIVGRCLEGQMIVKTNFVGSETIGSTQNSATSNNLNNPLADFIERPAFLPLTVRTREPHYFSPKGRMEGEKDLQNLTKTSPLEEIFLYVEGVDREGNKKSYWYEIGLHEEPTSANAVFYADFIQAIQAEFATVTGFSHYHFHPECKDQQKAGGEYPSPIDFSTFLDMIGDEATHPTMGYPLNVFDARVVTPTGVFIMKPNVPFIRNEPSLQWFHEMYENFFYAYVRVIAPSFPELLQAGWSRHFAVGTTSDVADISFFPLPIDGNKSK